MSVFLPPAITNLEKNDQLEWDNVLLEASLKLVKIAINHSNKQVKTLTTSRTAHLRSHDQLSMQETAALTEFETKKRRELETIKQRKLARDKVPNFALRSSVPSGDNAGTQLPTTVAATARRDGLDHPGADDAGGTAIVNLSEITISAEEEKLLSKGLNFCPASGYFDEFQILRDLDNFARNLRLREYFLDKPSDPPKQKSRPTSDWTPHTQRDNCLDLYIAAVQRDIMREYRSHGGKRNNLTKSEKESLKSLGARKDITIKPADKGGAIVILSTDDYIREGHRQLKDSRFYEPLTGDPTSKHTQVVTSALKELLERGKITTNEYNIMKPNHPSCGRFYMLPKIHKAGNPGRPIVSGTGTVTEPVSGYIDGLIKHIPVILDSYIKDTTHFLREISDLQVPERSYLVTLDVSSLYTNIPHDDGITSLIDMYELHRQTDTPDSHVVATLT